MNILKWYSIGVMLAVLMFCLIGLYKTKKTKEFLPAILLILPILYYIITT